MLSHPSKTNFFFGRQLHENPTGINIEKLPFFSPTNHQAKFDSMKKQMDSMEMEVMEARLIRASELNGEMDDDETGKSTLSETYTLIIKKKTLREAIYIQPLIKFHITQNIFLVPLSWNAIHLNQNLKFL